VEIGCCVVIPIDQLVGTFTDKLIDRLPLLDQVAAPDTRNCYNNDAVYHEQSPQGVPDLLAARGRNKK
jgi:hypothetical protein